jgi:AcrR family transcriptional regulator
MKSKADSKTQLPLKRQRGRPAGVSAVAHEHILDVVQTILQEKSFQDLTMEEVARRAGVGKPTLYKWWPSKIALVLDLFQERLVVSLTVPEEWTVAEKIHAQALELIRLLNGFFGKVTREIIAAGQSDPDVLRQYREIYVSKRRAFTSEVIQAAKASGELREDIDPERLIDMIYGPIYYRLLIGHLPLDAAFAGEIVDDVLTMVKRP